MTASRLMLDPKIRFIVSVPDSLPKHATPFQGFAFSLCRNHWVLNFLQQMPTHIFELAPEILPYRIARRIAGQAPITWYGQTPRALKSEPIPLEASFTVIVLDKSEKISDYDEWTARCPGPVTIVAKDGGHIRYSDLSFGALQARFLEVCSLLRALGTVDHVDEAQAAIASWMTPEERRLPYEIEGHGTIFPNAAVLRACGFIEIGRKPYARFAEGENAHLQQIISTTNTILDEREANPPSLANKVYPRTPDLNLYCPATYDLKAALAPHSGLDHALRREIQTILRVLENQSSYSFQGLTETQQKAFLGVTRRSLQLGDKPTLHPIAGVRQYETWLGTEAVACLAASEIGAVVRLPNRVNRTRGVVRQFAQHYRSDRPQVLKRTEMFRGVQRAIAEGFPIDLQALIARSQDGIRIIADAHIEWLDVKGIPLGLRYNVARIPVTPGNLFIQTLSSPPPIHLTPDDFKDILVVSGLPEADVIARQFSIAFDHFEKQWKDRLRIKFVRVSSQNDLITAMNAFQGTLMVFDGHGSHKPDQPGVLWLGEESIDVWTLRDKIDRIPPIVILSACDTHAADRNHATVANGFLALGARAVLGSVFPLQASHAAIFTARLLFRVSDYIPLAIKLFKRSLTWLEVVSGMLRRQAISDILWHLEAADQIANRDSMAIHLQMQEIMDSGLDDPFSHVYTALLDHGIPSDVLKREIPKAIATSNTISYLHLGRPETILINTLENLRELSNSLEMPADGI